LFPLKDDIPTRRFPVLTVAIIAIKAVMSFAFQSAVFGSDAEFDERVVEYGAIPYEVTHPGEECDDIANEIVCDDAETGDGTQPSTWLTILTSMFMHGGVLHLAGNMLFLWVFGNNIEDSMGRLKFAAFYLAGGVAAMLAQTLVSPDAAVPTIGASLPASAEIALAPATMSAFFLALAPAAIFAAWASQAFT